jgi:hypothetical protein
MSHAEEAEEASIPRAAEEAAVTKRAREKALTMRATEWAAAPTDAQEPARVSKHEDVAVARMRRAAEAKTAPGATSSTRNVAA